ncbi:MAG: hypothetical protein JJV98_21460 [Desulfosarcina sp.]|nr:hypothetical protein [Desulfobacterales bacterium]
MATIAPKVIVGVMGGGSADARQTDMAYRLGRLIAARGWVLLNGGRPVVLPDFDLRTTFPAYVASGQLQWVATPEEAVAAIQARLDRQSAR